MNRIFIVGIGLAVCLVGGGVSASSLLYGFNNSSQTLYRIDAGTGVASPLGPSGIGGVSDLTYDATGERLLGYDSVLTRPVEFDLFTGAATDISAFGAGTINGLEYNPSDGLFYVEHPSLDSLGVLDLGSGFTDTATIDREGLARLAYDTSNDTMYSYDVILDELVTVNLSTGAVQTVGATGRQIVGLAYDPESDRVFGVDVISDELVTLDRLTGAATLIGGQDLNGITSIVFVPSELIPEPSSLLLLVLATAAIGMSRPR